MTDEQRQEIMRCQADGMRAMTKEEMARRQLEAADSARPRGPLTSGEQEALRNFWGGTADERNAFIPDALMPTLFERFNRWMRA
jgi:hypothetical protein